MILTIEFTERNSGFIVESLIKPAELRLRRTLKLIYHSFKAAEPHVHTSSCSTKTHLTRGKLHLLTKTGNTETCLQQKQPSAAQTEHIQTASSVKPCTLLVAAPAQGDKRQLFSEQLPAAGRAALLLYC